MNFGCVHPLQPFCRTIITAPQAAAPCCSRCASFDPGAEWRGSVARRPCESSCCTFPYTPLNRDSMLDFFIEELKS